MNARTADSERESLEVVVARKQVEAQDICSYELVHPEGSALPAFTAGAHIDVQVQEGLARAYSLCNAPTESHRYLIAVLRDPASRGGSAAMHDSIRLGSRLRISVPRNHFPLVPEASHNLLLAGGIGVTPILCMAEDLARRELPFEMHYCSRTRSRTAFLERIDAAPFRERVQLHFDDGPEAQRLDIGEVLHRCPAGTHLYVCGPKGFIDAVRSQAQSAGWPDARVHFELFAAEIQVLEGDQPFEVELARTGRTVHVPADKTVVDALRDAGIELDVSCEQGICGVCMTRVLEGVPDHRDMYLSPEDQALNDCFTPCCSRAKTSKLVLDI